MSCASEGTIGPSVMATRQKALEDENATRKRFLAKQMRDMAMKDLLPKW